jgi:hypothetical protein
MAEWNLVFEKAEKLLTIDLSIMNSFFPEDEQDAVVSKQHHDKADLLDEETALRQVQFGLCRQERPWPASRSKVEGRLSKVRQMTSCMTTHLFLVLDLDYSE